MPNRCSLYRSASLCFFLRIPGLSPLSSLFLFFFFDKHLCVYHILTPFFLIIIIYNERFLSGVMVLQNNVIYGFKRTVRFLKFKLYTCQFFRQGFFLTWQHLVEASAFIQILIQIYRYRYRYRYCRNQLSLSFCYYIYIQTSLLPVQCTGYFFSSKINFTASS